MNGNVQTGNTAERDIIINGTHIHIKSVFNGKIPLEKALGNIANKKLKLKENSCKICNKS